MTQVPHVFTRRELNVMDAYKRKAISSTEACNELDVPKTTFYVWLGKLGMSPRQPRKPRPVREPTCPRCEVLLKCAPKGQDGVCGWCIEELAMLDAVMERNRLADAALIAREDAMEARI